MASKAYTEGFTDYMECIMATQVFMTFRYTTLQYEYNDYSRGVSDAQRYVAKARLMAVQAHQMGDSYIQ